MTAGDKGVAIVVSAGGEDLTGKTCTLLAGPGYPFQNSPAVVLSPMTVSVGGLSAVYMTTPTDFPSGGNWNLRLVVANAPSAPTQVFTSPPGVLYVYPAPQIAS